MFVAVQYSSVALSLCYAVLPFYAKDRACVLWHLCGDSLCAQIETGSTLRRYAYSPLPSTELCFDRASDNKSRRPKHSFPSPPDHLLAKSKPASGDCYPRNLVLLPSCLACFPVNSLQCGVRKRALSLQASVHSVDHAELLNSFAGLGSSWHAALGATAVSGEDRPPNLSSLESFTLSQAKLSCLCSCRLERHNAFPEMDLATTPSLCFKGHLHLYEPPSHSRTGVASSPECRARQMAAMLKAPSVAGAVALLPTVPRTVNAGIGQFTKLDVAQLLGSAVRELSKLSRRPGDERLEMRPRTWNVSWERPGKEPQK